MEIISQNYENILENLIINNFSEIIKNNKQLNPDENKVFNYIKVLDTLDEKICDIAKKCLITVIETIDRGFKNSPERRHSYHIKAHNTRTIMTIFGEITYRKTIYSHKHSYKSFCFIDDYLGLKKYDYFDPYIKSMVIKYAADNPCTKVANIIKNIFDITHMCSPNYNAMKAHYLFIQFAHTIRQLLDYGSSTTISFQGKIKEISFAILNELISSTIKLIENKLFQLRFNKLII